MYRSLNTLSLAGVAAVLLTVLATSQALALEPSAYTSGFEEAAAGNLEAWEDRGVRWTARRGDATIHTAHQRSGKQSLRILGGENKSVSFTIDLEQYQGDLMLSFWAERWTARSPFQFKLQGHVSGAWKDLYIGDKAIKVGGFHTPVKVALPQGVEKYRFVATTPDKSGIMIDDLRISPAVPMKIESVQTFQPVVPALVGNRTNPVALIEVKTQGALKPIALEALQINTAGTTNLLDIESVEVFYAGGNRTIRGDLPEANFPDDVRFGKAQQPSATMTFRGEQTLQEGANYFWVSYKLKESADIDGRVDAGCEWVKLSDTSKQVVPSTVNPDGAQRLGIALRNPNDDGARVYRIPGLVTTNKGTLITVYDIRYHGWGDLPGNIDVGMSRSTDGGRTWEPMKNIMDMGADPKFRYDGIGDPAVLVDRTTNTIWVAATWSHGNRSWRGSQPGLDPVDTGQFMLVKSEDDGKTWSEPINITKQVKDPSWCFLLQGPGKGITLSDGTIMFPAQYQDTPENKRLPRSSVIYSKDHGKTWQMGSGAYDDTTEAQVVELEDGVLMLNCRYNRARARVVRVSKDMGQSWSDHPTTKRALTEPGSCMASLINVDRELGKPYKGLLLFSNPASTSVRKEMTIRASTDGGMTWPEDKAVLIDHGKGAGYSCMTMIDEKTVGIVYEGNRAHMTFQRIPLADLLGTAQQD
ncbi:MAG: exo-alpha-sialidase [Phycisphaeraceae bacterium]